MEQLYRQRILKWQRVIINELKPDLVVEKLITLKCINKRQRDAFRHELSIRGYNHHNEMLLNCLLEQSPSQLPLGKFVSALESSGETRLAGLIKHEVSGKATLSQEDITAIQRRYSAIVSKMRTGQVLIILRKDKSYFTDMEMQELDTRTTDTDKADYLISEVIMKGTYRHLLNLRKALVHIGQNEIATYLPVDMQLPNTLSNEKEYGEQIVAYVNIKSNVDLFTLRSQIISRIMDPGQDLNKKMIGLYGLKVLTADALSTSTDTFALTMKPKHVTKLQEILEHIQNEHLSKIMKQYSHIAGKPDWAISIDLKSPEEKKEKENSFHLNHLGGGAQELLQGGAIVGAKSVLSHDSGYDSMSHVSVARSDSQRISRNKSPRNTGGLRLTSGSVFRPSQRKEEISLPTKESMVNVTFAIIHGKDYTPFDFLKMLVRCKLAKVSATDLKSDEGLNILHACIDKGRLSFLPIIVKIGWWKILAKEKIPEDSPNELRGKTAKQVAENKRAKKPLSDFNIHNEWENSLSVLMKACRSGDLSRAKQLIQSAGEDLYYCDNNGGNALFWAVINGNETLIDSLIEIGVDPTVRTKKNENLIHVAVSVGHSHLIRKFLHKSLSLDPWLLDTNQKTPLDRNAENGDIEILQEFVACGIHPKPNIASISAYMGRAPYLMYLFDHLEMPVDSVDMYNRTPLHRACEGSKINIVKYLLDKNADITLITCTGRNILHIIAESGSVELMAQMISLFEKERKLVTVINERDKYNGVELCFLIRGRDKGREAWHYVEVKRTMVPIFLLKTKSGNVDVAFYGEVMTSGWGVNPTEDVIAEIEETFKERRLNKSAALDMTPLHIALFKDHTEIAEMLLEKKCSVLVKDCLGNTPLMIAASKGNLKLMRELESQGAKFNEVNIDRKNASEIADDNEHEPVVHYIDGRDFTHKVSTFRDGQLTELGKKLNESTLDQKRRANIDVHRYLIDSLRDFNAEINQFLVEIGSGPVLEATDMDGPTISNMTRRRNGLKDNSNNRVTESGFCSQTGASNDTRNTSLYYETRQQQNSNGSRQASYNY